MRKLSMLVLCVIFVGFISCRDTKKEQQELEVTLDKIEAVEQDVEQTTEELNQKAEEVESALNELDNL